MSTRFQPTCVLVSDLHLTNNPRDAYRWGLFPWLAELRRTYPTLRYVFVLGDLTDAKDKHSSELVNEVVRCLVDLTDAGLEVYVLQGNHDYLKEGNPFFGFLEHLDNIHFISQPIGIKFPEIGSVFFVPHMRDSKRLLELPYTNHDLVLMHQTVGGAVASNGQKMNGELPSRFLPSYVKVFSGDIHVPQVVGDVEYVGSPYHVHFGDRFKPRAILLDEDRYQDVHFPTIERFTVDLSPKTASECESRLDNLRLKPDDQLKVRVLLGSSLVGEWWDIKRRIIDWCHNHNVMLCGLEMTGKPRRKLLLSEAEQFSYASLHGVESTLLRFAEKEKLSPDVVQIGMELMK